MSDKKLNIKKNVMEQINKEKVSMKPKFYFVLAGILTFAGLILSIIASVFVFSLIDFLIRANGPMKDVRLTLLISTFPWWILILGILGLVFGIIFLRKFDFSYKLNPLLLITFFVAAVIIAGVLIDVTGLDNLWLQRGPMQGIMRQYMQNNNLQPNGFGNMQRGRGFRMQNQN